MNKLIIAMLLLSTVSATAGAADAASDRKAVAAVVRTAVDKVLVVLKNDQLSRAEKRKRVSAIIDPVVDFRLMAMLSLGRKHWTQATPSQRKAFTDLFIATLKESYFEKIDLFTDETVEFEEPVASKTKYYVLTYILSKGERIKVAYRLYEKEEAWIVYDFEIEGVSVIKSYGSQYADFLRQGTIEQLLDKMREKVETGGQKEPGKGSKEKAS